MNMSKVVQLNNLKMQCMKMFTFATLCLELVRVS